MTANHRRMLARFQGFHRDDLYFTSNGFSMSQAIARKNIAEMVRQGLISKDGPAYRITRKGGDALYAAESADRSSSDRVANGTMTQPYAPSDWTVRPGGSDHQQWKSKGAI